MHLTRLFLPLLLAAATATAQAQGFGDMTFAAIPQYVSVKIGTGATAKTVTQLSIPFVAVVPITPRFNIDVATTYASSAVTVNDSSASSISGFTDTQVRANWTLGRDAVVFTVGVNIPSGQYTIPAANADAAGQIGNDFLLFPTSTYGAGLSGTAGVAVARRIGTWNLGIAAAARHGTQFDAFALPSRVLTFTPGDEYRARIGMDRAIGDGRISLGATYSKFGEDVADSTSFATGARLVAQGSLSVPLGTTDLFLSGWNLHRAKGQQFGGDSPAENVTNGSLAIGFHVGAVMIEPNVEGRFWQVDGAKAGVLGAVGGRLRFGIGALTILPGFTYQVGSLYSTLAPDASIDLTGWRTSLLVRVR